MKQILLATLIILGGILNAQELTFEKLLESISWNENSTQFSEKFKNNGRTPSNIRFLDGKKNGFIFNNILIGTEKSNASVYFDSITDKISEITISFSGDDKNFKSFSKSMDDYLFKTFGNSEIKDDEEDSFKRTWFKKNYIIDSYTFLIKDYSLYNLNVTSSNSKINGFRDFSWGENKSNIEKKEGKPNILKDYSDYYAFKSQIANLNCSVAYRFINDKLVSGKYVFDEKHSNKNDYINDLETLIHLLTTKYGKPVDSEYSITWKNSLYKKDPDDYGFAVSLGHLSYHYYWDNDSNTDLSVSLRGENGDITLVISYESKKFKNLKKETNLKNSLEGL